MLKRSFDSVVAGRAEWFRNPHVSRGSNGSRLQALHFHYYSANDRQTR